MLNHILIFVMLQTYLSTEYFKHPSNWEKLLKGEDHAIYMVYWLIPGRYTGVQLIVSQSKWVSF